jgi:Protein of unknown function (DUF2934)
MYLLQEDSAMPNRLVDVANKNDRILHTFPIAVGGTDIAPADTVYEAKALSAAGHAQLVPDAELEDLNAKMHIDRRGPLASYGDDRHILTETKAGLDQVVRERAYLRWQQDGCPDGNAETYWHQAHVRKDRPTRTGTARATLRRSNLPVPIVISPTNPDFRQMGVAGDG